MDDASIRDAFDAVDLAKAQLDRYRGTCSALTVSLTGSAAVVIAGAMLTDSAFALGLTLLLLGGVLAAVSLILLIGVLTGAHAAPSYDGKLHHPADGLRIAQQHRDRVLAGDTDARIE